MKHESKMIRIATSYPFAMFILGEMFVAASTADDAIADFEIAITRGLQGQAHVDTQ